MERTHGTATNGQGRREVEGAYEGQRAVGGAIHMSGRMRQSDISRSRAGDRTGRVT